MSKLSAIAKQSVDDRACEFSNDCECAQHFRTFGICFECGEIHENYESACCDNCGDMTVHSFDEAMEAALDD